MRVLVISRAPWRNDNSTGNTLTDFFQNLSDMEFYSLCMREQPPQNGVAKRHFCITEKQMLRRLLGKKAEIGVENSEFSADDGSEKKAYDAAKKHPSYLLYFARELVWSIGSWKNDNLKRYIEEIDPDIIFFPVFGCYYPHKILRYIHSLTDAAIVVFHADDHYTLKQSHISPFYWLYRFGLRKWVRRSVRMASLNYCISDIQKEDYNKAFGCHCKILTKFADFSAPAPIKSAYSKPLQIVFTGNINNNRWKSLAMLANTLKIINREQTKAQLRIYTATPLTAAMTQALDVDGASYLMGCVSSVEVSRIQSEADMLVHAEATDLKNRLAVRQSFSTKIVDYLKMARPVLAVGPKDVASIKHLLDHNGALVASNEQELYEKLTEVIEDDRALQKLAERAYACGKAHHNKEVMLTMLREDFEALTHT